MRAGGRCDEEMLRPMTRSGLLARLASGALIRPLLVRARLEA